MKNTKMTIDTIALILLLTISAILVALPAATAQEYVYSKNTYAFIGAIPNPVGVNEEVLLHVGITDYLNIVTDGWEGLTVTVTDPEGIESTLGPFRTDATGGTGRIFTPTKVGTYLLQTNFPEQSYTWTVPPIFDPELTGVILYEASQSEVLELVVNEDPTQYYTSTPLPSEYWTRPIDGQHRDWYTISGSWLEGAGRGAGLVPFNDDAPDTAHILWTKPFEVGGLAGGTTGVHAFDCGDAYEGKFAGSIIVAGILFYNKFHSGLAGGPPSQIVVAVDLHTGEELWEKPLMTPNGDIHRVAFGQTFYFDKFNYHAVFDFIWAAESLFDFTTFTFINNWHAFDPFTGEWQYSIENVPLGGEMFGASATVRGPNGEILIYNINANAGWMARWNSTRVIFGDAAGFDTGSYRPYGQTWDGSRGYESNITYPTGLPGSYRVILEDRILGNDISGWSNIGDVPINLWAVSIETGALLWQTTWQPPLGDLSIGLGASSVADGVFTLQAKETRQIWGFDIDTGLEIWGPTAPLHYLGIYGMNGQIAYGKLIMANTMAGTVTAYDTQNGNLAWTYEATDPYSEMLWGNNWPVNILFITDGKVYLGHSEHSPVDPKARGAPFIALDAATGAVVWRIDGLFRQTDWGGRAIIGDSIIATQDTYDQRIYAIGKGPSATTATASPKVSALGSSILIEGTVMDISPGTKEYALTARFPSGVPAVADESMSEWMLYVYKLFPRPADATGVEVVLEAIDPNGNYQYLGTATSDSSGNYGFTFTPKTEGQYMIMATFYGSKSYWGSTTTTYLTVDPAPEEFPDVPSAAEVAQKTISQLPAYPDVPSAAEVAQETISQLPAYPEPAEMPEIPEIPAYLTIDLVIIAAVAIVLIIGLYSIVKKQK